MKIFYTAFFLLVFSLTAEGRQIISLNYPPDKTVMEFDILSISLRVPRRSADLITVRVNDRKQESIVPSREFECFSVPLALGVNKIVITATKDGRWVDEVDLTVFRRSDLVSAYKDPPAGFQKDYFHMKDTSKCTACHVLEPTDADKKPVNIAVFATETLKDNKNAAATTSTCYSCHKKITAYPFVHGPVSVWSCLSCHDPQAEPKYSVKKPDTEACFKCHVEAKEDWSAKKLIHGPVNTSNCAICHNPHASDEPFNLVIPTWLLCLSCHADKGSGEHIVKGYVDSEKHPTHGKPDPLRKGRELTCASCHDPHASDSPKLWRLNVDTGIALCRRCHIGEEEELGKGVLKSSGNKTP